MAKKKWFTEAQLCDMIESALSGCGGLPIRTSDGIDLGIEVEHASRWREFEIAHKLRPDFLLYTQEDETHAYDVVEVKINADAESVAQLAHYCWTFNHALRNGPSGIKGSRFHKNGTKYSVRGHLIARTFDRQVHSIAAELGYSLWRIRIEREAGEDVVYFEEESHPFEDVQLDETFCKVLEGGDPFVQLEKSLMAPTESGRVVH